MEAEERLAHRTPDLLGTAGVAPGSREEAEGSWGHVPLEGQEAARARRRWPAALDEGRWVDLRAAVAWPRWYGDAGMRYGPARKLAPGKRRE